MKFENPLSYIPNKLILMITIIFVVVFGFEILYTLQSSETVGETLAKKICIDKFHGEFEISIQCLLPDGTEQDFIVSYWCLLPNGTEMNMEKEIDKIMGVFLD